MTKEKIIFTDTDIKIYQYDLGSLQCKEVIYQGAYEISEDLSKIIVTSKRNGFKGNREFFLSDGTLELFGYKDGSFTGSRRGGKVGLFKEADGGTLFLDEIGDISLKMQVKLLRVLQEKEIMPIGATEPEFVDVRIICATNKPLEKMIRNGEFREDLYYRLNVFPIVIPPLRERKTDIGIIVMHIIEKYNEFYERHVSRIDEDALELLYEEDWPGNVRELENVISRALINSREDNDVLSRSDIEFALKEEDEYMVNLFKKSLSSTYKTIKKTVNLNDKIFYSFRHTIYSKKISKDFGSYYLKLCQLQQKSKKKT